MLAWSSCSEGGSVTAARRMFALPRGLTTARKAGCPLRRMILGGPNMRVNICGPKPSFSQYWTVYGVMNILDDQAALLPGFEPPPKIEPWKNFSQQPVGLTSVSYTHLTLPTILRV